MAPRLEGWQLEVQAYDSTQRACAAAPNMGQSAIHYWPFGGDFAALRLHNAREKRMQAMTSRQVLAIDLGGTFVKVGLFEGNSLTWMQRTRVSAYQDASTGSGHLSPISLAEGIRSTLQSVRKMAGSVTSIMVTGQMAGLAIFDQAEGSSRPLITWQSSSSLELEAVRALLTIDFEELTGERLAPHLPLLKLRELSIEPNHRVTSLIGFVANTIAGERGSVIHVTDAASWGMCDVRTANWIPELLEFTGLDYSQLPRISWNIEPVGICSILDAPIYCAVGDHQAALLGATLQVDEVSVNLATGCQVSIRSISNQSPFQLRPFFAGEFLQTRTHLPAGRLLEKAVEEAYGEVSPRAWDKARRDVFLSRAPSVIDKATTQIITGIYDSYTTLVEKGSRRLLFSGGLIQRFPVIQRRLEDALGTSSRVFSDEDAALAGLATLAESV